MSFRQTPSGERRHLVRVQNPTQEPDGNGGYTEVWTDAAPATVYAAIAPATARDLERATANTVIAQHTHTIAMPFHPAVTEHTRLVFGTQLFSVVGVVNLEERNIELQLAAVELEGAPPLTTSGEWVAEGWA